MTAVLVEPITSSTPVEPAGVVGQSDHAQFATVYKRFFRVVRAWSRTLSGKSPDSDDIAQNVFVVVHRRLPDFDGNNIAGWLYRITVNQVKDHKRSAWERFRGHVDASVVEQMASPFMTPAKALEVRRELTAVSQTLAQFSDHTRAAFLSFEVEGYTSKEVAAQRRTSVSAVYGRVRSARIALRAQTSRQDGRGEWDSVASDGAPGPRRLRLRSLAQS
jgi:RNA polymerase sigma-70 factor (ECF subfamily)